MKTNHNIVVAALCCVQGALLLALCHLAHAETDPAAFINDALLKKGIKVQRARDQQTNVRQCDWTGDTGGGGANLEHCFWTKTTTKVPFTDDARVDAAQVVTASDAVFEMAQIKTLPGQALVERLTYRNCGPGSLTTPISLQISGADGWTTQKSQTISSTTTVNVSGKFDIGIAGATTSVSEAIGLSAATTNGESHSETVTRSFSGTLNNLQKGDAGVMQLLAYQSSAVIPYHATVVVDGILEANTSGYNKASDLLSVQERTIPFTGPITVDNLSDAYVDNEEAPQPLQCSTSNTGGEHRKVAQRFECDDSQGRTGTRST